MSDRYEKKNAKQTRNRIALESQVGKMERRVGVNPYGWDVDLPGGLVVTLQFRGPSVVIARIARRGGCRALLKPTEALAVLNALRFVEVPPAKPRKPRPRKDRPRHAAGPLGWVLYRGKGAQA